MIPAKTTNTVYVRLLADRLIAVPIEGTVSFAALSKAAGFDVLAKRWLILAAQRLANAETGAVFISQRGIGYLRLRNSESHALGGRARRRIRRISNTTQRFIQNAYATANDLPDEDRRKIHTELAALGLLQHLARDQNLPKMNGAGAPTAASVTRAVEALRAARFGVQE